MHINAWCASQLVVGAELHGRCLSVVGEYDSTAALEISLSQMVTSKEYKHGSGRKQGGGRVCRGRGGCVGGGQGGG